MQGVQTMRGIYMQNKNVLSIFVILCPIVLTSCSRKARVSDDNDVKEFFAKHKIGSSPDYAVMKNGTDHLLTIHGFADDLSVCMELIEPYNRDASLSTIPGSYTCVPLNH